MTPIMLDTAVIIVILLSVIAAFFRGFVKEMLTIVNIVGAAAAAWYLGGQFAPGFQKWMGAGEPVADGEKARKILGLFPPEVMGTFLSYFTVFFIALIILALAGMAISSSVKAMGLGPLDKALGMVFGALRGFLLVLLVYMPFAYFMPPAKSDYPAWVEESISFSVFDSSYNWLKKYFGEEGDSSAVRNDDDEEPRGPISGRLKKMGDDLMRDRETRERMEDLKENAQETYEDVSNEIKNEILTDEETHARP